MLEELNADTDAATAALNIVTKQTKEMIRQSGIVIYIYLLQHNILCRRCKVLLHHHRPYAAANIFDLPCTYDIKILIHSAVY